MEYKLRDANRDEKVTVGHQLRVHATAKHCARCRKLWRLRAKLRHIRAEQIVSQDCDEIRQRKDMGVVSESDLVQPTMTEQTLWSALVQYSKIEEEQQVYLGWAPSPQWKCCDGSRMVLQIRVRVTEFSFVFICCDVMNCSAGILSREERCPLMFLHQGSHKVFEKHGRCLAVEQYIKSP